MKISPTPLALEAYRSAIHLDEPFRTPPPAPDSETIREAMLDSLLVHLESEGASVSSGKVSPPSGYREKRRSLQAQLTVRGPEPLPDWFHDQVDRLLQYEVTQRQITPFSSLARVSEAYPTSSYRGADTCSLWQGDITSLGVDAIVNAANAQMLGCFQPFHACIDNVIHNAAGPRLREDCGIIMEIQGHSEGTGWAKITRGYNLPARYVLHTVGPIIAKDQEHVTTQQVEQLADSYRACLELAGQVPEIRSLAFCCISTGVFGFPQEAAAQITLDTVDAWLAGHSTAIKRVVFNVFTDLDREIYHQNLYA